MDSDSESLASNSEPEATHKGPGRVPVPIRFSAAQKACLLSYYCGGMTGTGKKHWGIIDKAAKDTNLSRDQVKRWIKKKSFRRRNMHSDEKVVKKKRLTPWQLFLKEYGESDDGKKVMMEEGRGAFNRSASCQYNLLSAEGKERLSAASASIETTLMTSKDIKKTGGRICKQVQKKFKALEDIRYKGIAVAFFEEDVQLVYTSELSITPQIIEYIRALMITSSPPPIPTQFGTDSSCLEKPSIDKLPLSNSAGSGSSITESPNKRKKHKLSLIESQDRLSLLPNQPPNRTSFDNKLQFLQSSSSSEFYSQQAKSKSEFTSDHQIPIMSSENKPDCDDLYIKAKRNKYDGRPMQCTSTFYLHLKMGI